jgi:hypothetical protein
MSTSFGKENEKSVDFNKNLFVFSKAGTHFLLIKRKENYINERKKH